MANFEQRLSRLEATLEALFRLRAIPPLDPSPSNDPAPVGQGMTLTIGLALIWSASLEN